MSHRSFFTRPCYSCGLSVSGGFLCPSCRGQILRLENRCGICSADLYGDREPVCPDCRRVRPDFRRNVSLADYHDPLVREVFHAFKFRGDLRAGREIARWVSQRIRSVPGDPWKEFLVVPVPLSRNSLKKRGFNQVEYVLKHARISFRPHLERVGHSRSQSELSAQDRKSSIRGQFRLKKGHADAVRGHDVLVVDDVFTTGSTASEISRVLKAEGAKAVEIMTFFRD